MAPMNILWKISIQYLIYSYTVYTINSTNHVLICVLLLNKHAVNCQDLNHIFLDKKKKKIKIYCYYFYFIFVTLCQLLNWSKKKITEQF